MHTYAHLHSHVCSYKMTLWRPLFLHLKSSKYILMHSLHSIKNMTNQFPKRLLILLKVNGMIFPQIFHTIYQTYCIWKIVCSQRETATYYYYLRIYFVFVVLDNNMGSALLCWMTKISTDKNMISAGCYYIVWKLYGGRNKNNWCHSSFLRSKWANHNKKSLQCCCFHFISSFFFGPKITYLWTDVFIAK